MKIQQIDYLKPHVCIIIFSLLVACSNESNKFVQDNNINIKTIDSLIGKRQIDILKIYGFPSDSSYLILSDSTTLLEYQLNLFKIIKERNNVKIMELSWSINNQNIKVWLKQDIVSWRVVDALIYGGKIQF